MRVAEKDLFPLAVACSLLLHAALFLLSPGRRARPFNAREYLLVTLARPQAKPSAAPLRAKRRIIPADAPKEASAAPAPEPPPAEEEEEQGGGEDFSSYLPFFRVLKLPAFVERVRPEYPPAAKLKGIESQVLVEVYIDAEGRPRKVVVLRSGGEDFDRATIAAVEASRFSPAFSKEGKAVPVRVRIPYVYELQ